MQSDLCKGGCGNIALAHGWCKLKWQKNSRYAVACPTIESKRGKSISKYRLLESSVGLNPMQNPTICAKNHSMKRAEKCSAVLKLKGSLGLLPQQTESYELKLKRQRKISLSLKKLWDAGIHPRQRETSEQKKARFERVSKGLALAISEGRVSPNCGFARPGRYAGISFRSQWEIAIAKFLDAYGFNWRYESLKLPYFDSIKQRLAYTVPDFYLPDSGKIIEVKGRWLNSQKTKDKLIGISSQGFAPVLIGESEMKLITKNPVQLLYLIESAQL